MAIIFHLLLLTAITIATAVCLFVRGGRPNRPLGKVLLAVLPLWLIGSICFLLLSANGIPTVEWIVPTIAMLLIGLWCKSDRLFKLARWGLPVAALVLCVNFGVILQSGFTASPSMSQGIASARQSTVLKSAAKELRRQYAPDTSLPAGPVRELLPGSAIGDLTIASAVRQWHTPLTRLYQVRREPAVVWYPGGAVGEAVGELQVSPVNDDLGGE